MQQVSFAVVPHHRVCFSRRNVDVVSPALWRTIKGGDNLASLCLTAPRLSRLSRVSLSRSFYRLSRDIPSGRSLCLSITVIIERDAPRNFHFAHFLFRARTSSLFIRSYLAFDFVTSVGNLILFPSPTLLQVRYAYTIKSCDILKLISVKFSELHLKNLYERIKFSRERERYSFIAND